MGLKSVKKKALYDGDAPICHLYYGDDQVLESTLEGCSARLSAEERDRLRFEVGDGGSGPIVDFVAEQGLDQAGRMSKKGSCTTQPSRWPTTACSRP